MLVPILNGKRSAVSAATLLLILTGCFSVRAQSNQTTQSDSTLR